MPRSHLLLPCLLLLLAPCLAGDRKQGYTELYKKVSPTVVGITARRGSESWYGTGVLIHADGYILTGTTVVPPGSDEVTVTTLDGKRRKAKLIGASQEKEAALIQIEGKDLPHVDMGQSGKVELGEAAFTLGNVGPPQEGGSLAKDDLLTMSAGVVSGTYDITEAMEGASYTGHVLETTAAVNGGGDGGPLFDSSGKVIGVISLSYSRMRWLGVAVPIDEVRPYLQGLAPEVFGAPPAPREEGDGPAWLGVVVGDEEEPGTGVPITDVNKGGPAERAGVAKGQRLLDVDGVAVHTAKELEKIVRGAKPGRTVKLKLKTQGGIEELTVRLGKEPL